MTLKKGSENYKKFLLQSLESCSNLVTFTPLALFSSNENNYQSLSENTDNFRTGRQWRGRRDCRKKGEREIPKERKRSPRMKLRNLIMRSFCKNSPLCADPAKWRGSRQPNNQTINHRGPGQRSTRTGRSAGRLLEPVYVTRKHPVDFDEQIHS